ncbi:SC5A6-like protein [Mya arenaria]|uniref:SC5A6-like protein n=1 Tax=Mya arenaria TaxID=6604 RepID=A0ABY7F2A7_MYAAR|nr:SC5A6-like protein [Mya arenaria]
MTTELIHQFGVADYIVFGILMFGSVAIGIFFAIRDKRHNTTTNYFLGNRKLGAFPVGLSFVVTFQSSILILGFPAEAYAYGLQYAMQCIGVLAGYLLAALIAVPIFHPLKITSVYEYYQLRYGTNAVRYVALTLGVIHYTFYMGIVMYGTALALESAAGLPLWSSIVMFSLVAIIYTSIGGFKAVIWTDVFQSLIMIIGILAVLIKCTIEAGGPANIARLSSSRVNLFNFNPDPTIRHTFWTLVFGAPTQFFYLAITQAGIQRINSTPTMKEARRVFFIAAPIYALTWILALFQGLTIFHTTATKVVTHSAQIVPFTMLELFHDNPGLPGLFIAALSAASLSTISSGLNSLAAVTYEDFIKAFAPNIKDTTGANISKFVVVLYGFISVGFAFLLSNVKGPLGQVLAAFMGAVSGPEAGLFLVSVFIYKARPKVVIIGTLTGVAFTLWLTCGQNFSASIPNTPYLPSGPTDQCPRNSNITYRYSYSNSTIWYSNNTNENEYSVRMNIFHTSTESGHSEIPSRSALNTFYSISYMYFHLIGVITVIFVSTIISLLIQPKKSEPIHAHTTLPFSIFIPPFLKKRIMGKKKNIPAWQNGTAKGNEDLEESVPLN